MRFRVLIPARYASSRLPGKPLRPLAGRPMLEHVYRAALESGAEQVVVATDDERIRAAAEGFGAPVCMTGTRHQSGTERLAEAVGRLGCAPEDIIVNLQGDEPFMPPLALRQVAAALAERPAVPMATLCTPIVHMHELFDYHVVKLVRDAAGNALYFSRAPLPWHREEFATRGEALPADGTPFLRHIGLYAYRAGFLQEYVGLAPSPLERAESLEQLRVLWHGRSIYAELAQEVPGPGIDTEDDLAAAEARLRGGAA